MATAPRPDVTDLSRPSTGWAEELTAQLLADDEQIRRTRPRDEVTEAMHQPGLRLAQVVAAALTGYADRPALGERARELITDPVTGRTSQRLLPRFDTITYRELWWRVRAVAAAWRQDSTAPLRQGDFVATLGFTSTDYATVDLACIHEGAVSVPLQSSASAAQLRPIIEETEALILATSVEQLAVAIEAVLGSAHVRRVIVFDHHAEVDEHRDAVAAARARLAAADSPITLETLREVIDRGALFPTVQPRVPGPQENPLTTLIYTSGSTGTPKGAMYPESLILGHWLKFSPRSADLAVIRMHYLPLSHLTGRTWLLEALAAGGTGYFTASSDMSTLFEDIGFVRPIDLFFIPRLCDMLFQHCQGELERRAQTGSDKAAVEAEVKAEIRDTFLGGRLVRAAFGSAPLAPAMTAFVESCVGVMLHNGYGSTEAGTVVIDGRLARPPVLDYKLVDVPELGYFTTDAPHPRGELLIKTRTIIPGYYKRPEVTAAIFDDQGYYRTGDVMAETGPDRLVYLDRRSNVIKLSQGEFVAVAQLELLFAASPMLEQVFLHGNSERAYLLAVVVPTTEVLSTMEELGELKRRISESLQQIARDGGLNRYEIPRDLIVETEPFSTGNGLLSELRKPLRPRLKERYGPRLEQLYTELAEREGNELSALRAAGPGQPVFPALRRAVRALLGSADTEVGPQTHFSDLGGDSLSALTLSTLLTETFQVEVPVGVVISPAGNLHQLADYIETALSSESKRPTFAAVHGVDTKSVRATELTLDKFIARETLIAAPGLPRASGAPKTVLLSGANGYLGRFLCLEWLQRLSRSGGKLICLVRGSTEQAAAKRLLDVFDSGDADLVARVRELAAEHLEVLVGDIGEPDLGLDGDTWSRLADTVDLVVHPAAFVNHVLPYDQLFGPNVVGTAELIRLAITSRIKPISYVSTAAVLGSQVSCHDEDSDIRVASPARELGESYASGYATSKWAGEVLLREAHEACGLPVAVFRSDMILAHPRYIGQLNVPDLFTRLVLSLISTGVAPGSFYLTDADGSRRAAHYDGLPVDFTAAAITELGVRATEGYQTFHVLNPHEDGISLDTCVDWLIQAGYPIQRIEDFAEWTARFETALRGLPDRQRQHSLLPLLRAFAEPAEPVAGSWAPAERFRAAVRAAKVGPEGDIPHISAALIGKYADDLVQLSLISDGDPQFGSQ